MTDYDNKTMPHSKRIVLAIVEWIESCIYSNEKIKINMVARKSGYSLRHMHNIFKKEVGVTIGKYIRLRRITRSALLVRFTNRSIFDISLELNFSSQQSFNRTFTSHFGCAPLQYRSRNYLDTSKLYPPYSTAYKDIKYNIVSGFEINLNIAEYKYDDVVIGERNKKTIETRFKYIMNVLHSHDVAYVASSINLLDSLESKIGVRAYIGFNEKGSTENTLYIHHEKYIKVNFKGIWSEYTNFSYRLYVNSNFVRVDGYDIEEFRLISTNDEGQPIFDINIYIPTVIAPV
jgi:AraC-like DNA-binding protein